MTDTVWDIARCGYDVEPGPGNSVKVTYMEWKATLTEGEFTATLYGTTPDDQNRVYALPALKNVPEHVIVGWAQDALGPDEVANIEAKLAANVAEQTVPTSGGINY